MLKYKLTCPVCNAVCEVEVTGYFATKKAAKLGHAFLEKHDHRPTRRWTLP